MSVSPWLIGLALALAALIAAIMIRRRRGGEMIERQHRAAQRIGLPTPTPRGVAEGSRVPDSLRSDEAAVLAVPEVRTAIESGRKIEAIKLVREHTGLGLKEAKELVERLPRGR